MASVIADSVLESGLIGQLPTWLDFMTVFPKLNNPVSARLFQHADLRLRREARA